MQSIRLVVTLFLAFALSCTQPPDPNKTIPVFLLKFSKNYFAHPIGEYDHVTEKNDRWDAWYN
ncbi:MAG TPA: hypothetical protein VJL58_09535, partial [Pyrinomonadaceae bacterium]|nr:hypothetical protein [Pyrinomonadaceae bacterium]